MDGGQKEGKGHLDLFNLLEAISFLSWLWWVEVLVACCFRARVVFPFLLVETPSFRSDITWWTLIFHFFSSSLFFPPNHYDTILLFQL